MPPKKIIEDKKGWRVILYHPDDCDKDKTERRILHQGKYHNLPTLYDAISPFITELGYKFSKATLDKIAYKTYSVKDSKLDQSIDIESTNVRIKKEIIVTRKTVITILDD